MAFRYPRWPLQAPLEASNASRGSRIGTLSAVLRDRRNPSTLFALTAGHALAAYPSAASDDRIEFCEVGGGSPLFTGRLAGWVPNFSTFNESSADAAIAQVDARALGDYAARSSDWPQGTGDVTFGTRVVMRAPGRHIAGIVNDCVSCRLALRDTEVEYVLTDVWAWDAEDDAIPGDSGAPIWNDADQLVGIHAGTEPGNPRRPLLIPIDRILRYFNADVVVRDEPLWRLPSAKMSGVFDGVIPTVSPSTAPGAAPAPADTEVLAQTMWGEARGEGEAGMRAVAYVVLNRAAHRNYWGASIGAVCRKPYQFSCWNLNDPNLEKLRTVTYADPQFKQAFDIAAAILSDARGLVRRSEDPTNGATHYHEWSLQPPPRWARGRTPCARIGRHVFYNDIG